MINSNHTIAILAFNNHELTMKNIIHLIKNGQEKNIFLFDNGSNPSFKSLITNMNISYYREEKNTYVNPAWNKLFEIVQTKYLTLLNNDCFNLSKNYYQDILPHMDNNDIALSSCKTINIKHMNLKKLKYYELYYNLISHKKLRYTSKARRQGWIMTINLELYKKLNYKIPDYIKIWYGDDWIWSQIVKNNLNYVIYKNRYALHLRNKTISNSNLIDIVNHDKENFKNNNNWLEKSIHQKSRLFNRYI